MSKKDKFIYIGLFIIIYVLSIIFCFITVKRIIQTNNDNNIIQKDSIEYNIYQLDSVIYNIEYRDSIVYNIKKEKDEKIKEANNITDSSAIELFKLLVSKQ